MGIMTHAERRWWNRYDRYLRSEGWQLTREAAFRRDGYRCRRCGFRGSPLNPLQADHLSYTNYNRTGRTPVDDLQTLCRKCHQVVSGRRFRRLNVRGLTRLAVLLIGIWLLTLMMRPAHTIRPSSPVADGNTLVIPSKVQIHHHHRHQHG